MAMKCASCTHPERSRLDAALLSGQSARSLSREFGIGEKALLRHKKGHLSAALAKTARKQERRYRSLLDRFESLVRDTEQILDSAKETGKVSTALAAVREVREGLKVIGHLTGELKPDGAVEVKVLNLQTDQEWVRTRMRVLDALLPYPEAREAVVEALTRDAGEQAKPALALRPDPVPWRHPGVTGEADEEEQV